MRSNLKVWKECFIFAAFISGCRLCKFLFSAHLYLRAHRKWLERFKTNQSNTTLPSNILNNCSHNKNQIYLHCFLRKQPVVTCCKQLSLFRDNLFRVWFSRYLSWRLILELKFSILNFLQYPVQKVIYGWLFLPSHVSYICSGRMQPPLTPPYFTSILCGPMAVNIQLKFIPSLEGPGHRWVQRGIL